MGKYFGRYIQLIFPEYQRIAANATQSILLLKLMCKDMNKYYIYQIKLNIFLNNKKRVPFETLLVEYIGVEPMTSCMPCKRSSLLS